MSDEEEICAICLEDLNNTDNGMIVNAHDGSSDCIETSRGVAHKFHINCIQAWCIAHPVTTRCPECRCLLNRSQILNSQPKFVLSTWLRNLHTQFLHGFVHNIVTFVILIKLIAGFSLLFGMLFLPFYAIPEKKAELINDIERLYTAIPELKDALVEFANALLSEDIYINRLGRRGKLKRALDMMWKKMEGLEQELLHRIQSAPELPKKIIKMVKKPPKGIVAKYQRSLQIQKSAQYEKNLKNEKIVSSFLEGKEDTYTFLDDLVDKITSEQESIVDGSDRGTFKEKIFDRILTNFDTGNAEHFAVLLLGRLKEEVWMRNTAPNSLAGVEHPLNSADIYPLGVQGLENFHREGRKPSLLGSESPPPPVMKSPLAYLSLAGQPHYERLASKGGSKRIKRRRRATHRRK